MDGIVVLISGRGSNLRAICDAGLSSKIKCVISNKAYALGLTYAKEQNISTHIIENKQYKTKVRSPTYKVVETASIEKISKLKASLEEV